MNLVFMGTPDFAVPGLRAVAESAHRVALVVTTPDHRRARGGEQVPSPVNQEARKNGIPVATPESLADAGLHAQITALSPDLIVIIAFKILPKSLFSLPRHGSINVHASLLPKYRGAAPINWAIMRGERETGLSSFYLRPTVDTGDIIHQMKTEIGPDETFGELYQRLSVLSAPFLLETINRIESGDTPPIPQDNSRATSAPKIKPENTLIDFARPCVEVRNFVRGLSPTPGALCFFRGQRVKLLRLAHSDTPHPMPPVPGTLSSVGRRLLVACADGYLELAELKPEGKPAMSGAAFLNGYEIGSDEQFHTHERR